ncbi:ABC transporter ATP-binding protein [Paenibacillus sp. 453mf]|uniref:ABC transporter ATP-binding protein n=1 Tax=Paenibacillus sp. 453mf TaxID=1761874 RepID=UPI0008ED22A8|nr:ABC transporter ATP-binding protein [Paenibacillus sp. 453mf]SFS36541.1 ATP-binding cassette, subfamily B [Paenibacillus sp. 453mf]
MALIFSYLRKYRVAAIAALFMLLLELMVELIQPYLIQKIIDDGIQQENMSVVWTWGGVLLISAFIAFAAGISSSFYAAHASQGFGADLRESLYKKVQSFSYAVFNRFATSSLIIRLTGDITQLQDTVFMGLRFATRVPLVVIGSVIMALVVNVKLGLFLAVTVPVLLLFIFYIMKKVSIMFRAVQNRLDEVNGVAQENLIGIRLIRVFVRMGHEIERFGRSIRQLMTSTMAAQRFAETTMPFIMLVMNASILTILWFGRNDINVTGDATMGEVVAVINYAVRTMGSLSMLSWIVATLSRASASRHRISEVLDTDRTGFDSVQEGNGSGTTNISKEGNNSAVTQSVQYEQVSFSYPGSDLHVLEKVSFEAKAGERIAIMGATGSGKTSLVQLLLRLYDPDEGMIRIDGNNIKQYPVDDLRGFIGYVPQEAVLFTGSVKENIAWGNPQASEEEVKEAARKAQIHQTIESLASGYDTMLGQRGVNLSGGQKQRLSIARALVRNPQILILDDSTSALDVKTEAALLDELSELSCTTFLITQKISSTLSADLILLLDEGRLIAQGTHQELLQNSELYRRIYESQFGQEAKHA